MSKYSDSILRIVETKGQHLTAEEIFFQLKQQYPTVVQATVYNNLKKLYEEKKIRKISFEGYPDRYDGVIPHDHLVCRQCGRLADIHHPRFAELLCGLADQISAENGVGIDGYDLKLFYICNECREQTKASEKYELS